MTPDDIDALSKAWNESKAATDAVLAKFPANAFRYFRPLVPEDTNSHG